MRFRLHQSGERQNLTDAIQIGSLQRWLSFRREAEPYRCNSDHMTAVQAESGWCDSDRISQKRGRTLQVRFRLDHNSAGYHSGERLKLTNAIQIGSLQRCQLSRVELGVG